MTSEPSSKLTTHEYRDLIRDALPGTPDSDTENPSFHGIYTPDTHRRALQPDVTIIRGARGVGKTYWYKSLQDDALRKLASDAYQIPTMSGLHIVQGYGTALEPQKYPGPQILHSLLSSGFSPYDIWMSVALTGLGLDTLASKTWAERLQWVVNSPEQVESALSDADRRAQSRGSISLVIFDALDQLHRDRVQNDRLAVGILRIALELRLRTRFLRAKIFIRPDMLDGLRLDFTDSSKLLTNAADLTWSRTNLYGLFFHFLGNQRDSRSSKFRSDTRLPWREIGSGKRFVPHSELSSDRDSQQRIFVEISGPHMGTNHRKCHTYPWLPNHLMDGIGQVSPRSFLSALSTAAEWTASHRSSWDKPLHYEGIRAGVQRASQIRAGEIRENIPWAFSLVQDLGGLQVPILQEAIEDRWAEYGTIDRLRPDITGQDGEEEVHSGPNSFEVAELIAELVELGVMSYRRDGRLDLPDVYRIAFDVGRKGGVRRLTQ